MKPETPVAAAAAKKPRVTKPAPASPADGHDEAVRHMAYLLYVERGRVDGYEVEDWLRAEALVSQQAAASRPAASEAPKAATVAAKRAPAAAAAKTPAAPAAAKAPAAKRPAVAAKRAPAKPRSE